MEMSALEERTPEADSEEPDTQIHICVDDSEQETQVLGVLVSHEGDSHNGDNGDTSEHYLDASMMEMEVHVVNPEDVTVEEMNGDSGEVSHDPQDDYHDTSIVHIQTHDPESLHEFEEGEDEEGQVLEGHDLDQADQPSPPGNYAFTCDLCQEKFKGQFVFFEHLRTHYDEASGKASKQKAPVPEAAAILPAPTSSSNILREKLKILKERRRNSSSQVNHLLPPKEEIKTEVAVFDNGVCSDDIVALQDLNPDNGLLEPQQDELEEADYEEQCQEEEEEMVLDAEHHEEYVILKQEIDSDRDEDEGQDEVKYSSKVRGSARVKGGTQGRKAKNQEILCPDCGEFFESLTKLKVHKKLVHDAVVPSKKASATLTRSERLRLRVSGLKCKECSKVFNHKNSLVYHMKSHSNERNHQCTDCGKKFLTSSALNVHMRLHTGEKPYHCQHCAKPFRQWGDLAYHMVSLHSNVRAYVCEFCGKDFARKYSLTVHRRIHTLERDYSCEFCTKSFRAASYLQSHRRIHTGEKPHNCDVCGKPFRVKSDMKRHRQSHNRHEPKVRIRKDKDSPPVRGQPAASTNNLRVAFTRSKASSASELNRGRLESDEGVIMHNLVALDESGQIIELVPQIAEQLRAGQVIQVPLATSGRATTRRITIENGDGSIITGDLEPHHSINEDELKEEEEAVPVEYIQHAVLATDAGDPSQGSLYVWPAFM